MSWDARHTQWQKMYLGRRYRVCCADLALPRERWTKQDSYLAANDWWEKQLTSIHANKPMTIRDRQEMWAKEHAPHLIDTDEQRDAELLWNIKFAEESGIHIDEDADPVAVAEFFGSVAVWADRLDRTAETPLVKQLQGSVDDFLGILRTQQKAKTFKEVRDFLLWLVTEHWTPGMDVSQIEENKVTETYSKIAALEVSQPTKKKRWGFFRRFITWLYTERRIESSPRNLAAYKFEVAGTSAKEYPLALVKAALAALTGRERCWAMLGLNTGMTNVDIGGLKKDMVQDGYLTRKRIKTEANADVPMVSYRLWPETLELLHAHRSEHDMFWFVSATGTKLVDYRMENGEVRIKDLIGKVWQEIDCPIPLSKFRNAAAGLLETHKHYGRYVTHFLAHSPKSLKDKHYAAPSQSVFDAAMQWLHGKLFP
jgi:hypothetical protein